MLISLFSRIEGQLFLSLPILTQLLLIDTQISSVLASYSKTPSIKDVVTSLMRFERTEKEFVAEINTDISQEKCSLKYRCMRQGWVNPVISFLEKHGFRNPNQHLKSCYARGKLPQDKEEALLVFHCDARASVEKRDGTIMSHFQANTTPPQAIDFPDTLRYIVMNSQPFYIIEYSELRRFSNQTTPISH